MTVKYSLIIPCYNEASNLPELIHRISSAYTGKKGYEIILVDNGSSDDTPVLLQAAVAEHPDILTMVRVAINQGYGWGILQGLNVAKGKYLGWTHADMQTDPADALEGFTLLELQSEPLALVKGRRYGRPLADVFFTMGMSLFDSALFGMPLWDINAQPTLFTRSFYKTWHNPPHDFALDLFAYASAVRQQATIARFPVHFGERLHGTSHWNVSWAAKWKFIRRTVDFSLALKKSWNSQ